MILQGNCLDKLKELQENSVDSIVTDPPYELGFMGKSWDSTGIANNVEMWKECLRVLKPGGHLLSFGGTRTYHRMAVAIEDAGFEVRDMIEWVYGSGFPKSLNIASAIAKREGAKREGAGTNGNTFPLEHEYREYTQTENSKQWEGWGTALKPAHEPICMARKPLAEKTVAENCLTWGTGGINIDESRVEFEKGDEPSAGNRTATFGTQETISGGNGSGGFESNNLGRFPSNFIHDNSEEVRGCFPDSRAGSYKGEGSKSGGIWSESTGKPAGMEYGDSGNASRFFKSIIYTAKASKSERNKGCEGLEVKGRQGKMMHKANNTSDEVSVGFERFDTQPSSNNHPTVKPIALMEYLIQMVTPKGGIVLDPFAGSGSTLVAAKQSGFQYIGIELEPEYIKIIEARLKGIKERLL